MAIDINNLKSLIANGLSDVDSLSSPNDILVLERAANYYGTRTYYLSADYTRTGNDFPFAADSTNVGSCIAFRGATTGSGNEIYVSDGSTWSLLTNINDASNPYTWNDSDHNSLFDLTNSMKATQHKITQMDSALTHPFDITDVFNMAERQSRGTVRTFNVDSAEFLNNLDSDINIVYDTVSSDLVFKDINSNTWKVIQ